MRRKREKGWGGKRAGSGRPPKRKPPPMSRETVGVDPAGVDPRRVLASIAIDLGMPPTARVSAAKALLERRGEPHDAERVDRDRADEIGRRAAVIMNRRGLN